MTSVVAQEPSSGKLLRKKERKAVSAIDVSNIARTASAEARSDQDEIREFIAAKNSPEAMTLNSPCHSSLISQSSFKRTNTAGSTSPVGINSSFKSVTSQSGSTRTASSGSSFKNVFSSFRNSFRTNMRKSFEGSVSESMILRASKFELDEHDLKGTERSPPFRIPMNCLVRSCQGMTSKPHMVLTVLFNRVRSQGKDWRRLQLRCVRGRVEAASAKSCDQEAARELQHRRAAREKECPRHGV